jgi:hypothetical protein
MEAKSKGNIMKMRDSNHMVLTPRPRISKMFFNNLLNLQKIRSVDWEYLIVGSKKHGNFCGRHFKPSCKMETNVSSIVPLLD